jgi:hypothetical protein
MTIRSDETTPSLAPNTPRVFVGCSSEAAPIATAILGSPHLQTGIRTQFWQDDMFRAGMYTLEILEDAISHCQFAILIATPDDLTVKREAELTVMRDNVLFVFGLFIGAIGRKRTLLLTPSSSPIHLPSDLEGLTHIRYEERRTDDPDKPLEILEPTLTEMRSLIDKEWDAILTEDAARREHLQKLTQQSAVASLSRAADELYDIVVKLPSELVAYSADKETRYYWDHPRYWRDYGYPYSRHEWQWYSEPWTYRHFEELMHLTEQNQKVVYEFARHKASEVHTHFSSTASEAGVSTEFEALMDALITALHRLPSPRYIAEELISELHRLEGRPRDEQELCLQRASLIAYFLPMLADTYGRWMREYGANIGLRLEEFRRALRSSEIAVFQALQREGDLSPAARRKSAEAEALRKADEERARQQAQREAEIRNAQQAEEN